MKQRISVKLDLPTYERLKLYCLRLHLPMQEVVEDLVKGHLELAGVGSALDQAQLSLPLEEEEDTFAEGPH